VLLFFPVYDSDSPPTDELARRKKLRGFAVGVLLVEDLTNKVLSRHNVEGLQLRIVETDANSSGLDKDLLYESPQIEEQARESLRRSWTHEVGGRPWEFQWTCRPTHFASHKSSLPWIALLVGSLFSTLVGWTLNTNRVKAVKVAELVEERTRELKQTNSQLKLATEKYAESNRILKESELELEQILEASPAALVYADSARKIARVNPAFESVFGWTREEVLGKKTEIIYADYASFREQGKTRFNPNSSKSLEPYEVEYTRKDGSTFTGESVGAPLLNEEGNVVAYLGLIQDVTDRKKAQQALLDAKLAVEESEQRFRNLANSASPLAWITELDSNCSWLNDRWMEYTGKPIKEHLGHLWINTVHPDDQEKSKQTYLAAFEKQEEFKLDYRLLRHDGVFRWFTVNATPRFNERGEFIGYVGMSFDTHETRENRIEMERSKRKLEVANQRLETSNAELEQFAFAASHDLQEPLRKMAAFSELLKKDYADSLDEEGKVYIDFIVDGAIRMQTLIRDILQFSQVKYDQENLEFFEAADAVQSIRHNLAEIIENSGAVVTTDRLPRISIERKKFEQLLQNLVANGIKYCDAPIPKIHIGYKFENEEHRFSVSDNGIGIAPEYHERVFGLFKRLHSKADYPGTGIGLAICKRVVEQWGGAIWLQSEEGEGSTFFKFATSD
jgi:PAS domain S-box-containing protein